MRTIKFRGVSIDETPASLKGQYVYGDYLTPWEEGRGTQIRMTKGDHKDEFGNVSAYCYKIEVDPDSVAQLIGVDKKGNEVYEGDEIESRFGSMRLATFRHYDGIIDGAYTLVK